MFARKKVTGFTLVELLAVLVLISILGATVLSRFISNSAFQVQASRDQVVALFHSAQQLAMSQTDRVQLSTSGGQVTIAQDTGGDGFTSADNLLQIDGISLPFVLASGQVLTAQTFSFDRLGRTGEAELTLSQEGSSAVINVEASGFIE